MILGISNPIHNSSAVLVRDGTVLAAIEEERMSRYKRDGRPPVGAVNALLDEFDPGDITRIAASGTVNWSIRRQISKRIPSIGSIGRRQDTSDKGLTEWRPSSTRSENSNRLSASRPGSLTDMVSGACDTVQQPDRFLHELGTLLAAETPLDDGDGLLSDRMEYVDHHRAHANGAFFTSGFSEATVVTIDSAGDSLSSAVYHGRGTELERIAANSDVDSIGRIWSRLPTVYGFKGARHAGKFMGLAAYGDEPPADLRDLFHAMIDVDGMDIRNHWARENEGADYETLVRDLRDIVGEYPAPTVARAFQERTEELLSDVVAAAVDQTGASNLAVAGGVMANVKVNQRLYELSAVDRLWVQQAMSDSGLSLGAAYHVGSRRYDWTPERLDSVALGPSYDCSAVDTALARYEDEASFTASQYDDIESLAEAVAGHLADGRVVCLCSGRMEYGPRALGQRSILYQPTDRDAIKWLNDRLNRTEFMPFAPVTLAEAASECYEGYDPERCLAAAHMTISLDCTETMANRSPGVVHVDGTARPQIIDSEDDALYYEILSAYRDETGIPTLINTSFNMHGEPLVCTPSQALQSWIRSNNEILVLEDRILEQEDA